MPLNHRLLACVRSLSSLSQHSFFLCRLEIYLRSHIRCQSNMCVCFITYSVSLCSDERCHRIFIYWLSLLCFCRFTLFTLCPSLSKPISVYGHNVMKKFRDFFVQFELITLAPSTGWNRPVDCWAMLSNRPLNRTIYLSIYTIRASIKGLTRTNTRFACILFIQSKMSRIFFACNYIKWDASNIESNIIRSINIFFFFAFTLCPLVAIISICIQST